jgi:hypothetical protein
MYFVQVIYLLIRLRKGDRIGLAVGILYEYVLMSTKTHLDRAICE